MNIVEVPIEKLRPDQNQPRKTFDEEAIRGMARSIITTGLINPVEVDKKFVIVTGEMRWRASKIAGLKKIPCKVIDIDKNERFMRQVIENIHHNTMTVMETARALKQLLGSNFRSPEKPPHTGGRPATGVTWLSKKIGRSDAFISDTLSLLDEPKPVQKKIEKGGKWTIPHELKRTKDPVIHKELQKKFVSGELDTAGAHGTRAIVGALNQYPKEAKKILKQDYSKMNAQATRDKLHKLIPNFTEYPVTEAVSKALQAPVDFSDLITQVVTWLEKHPRNTVGALNEDMAVFSAMYGAEALTRWLKGEKVLIVEKKKLLTVGK